MIKTLPQLGIQNCKQKIPLRTGIDVILQSIKLTIVNDWIKSRGFDTVLHWIKSSVKP